MDTISAFKVGRGNWSGSQSYRGKMDEFAVFASELSEAEIEEIMTSDITPSHPEYNNLVLYNNSTTTTFPSLSDSSPVNGSNGLLFSGSNYLKLPEDYLHGFEETMIRDRILCV
jgi:hypothetical protein